MIPQWIRNARRERGLCEQCGERAYVTIWAGNGWLICQLCTEKRQAS